MVKLIFGIDKEKDILNLWELCNIPNPWEDKGKIQLKPSLKEKWKNKSLNNSKEEISVYLNEIYNLGYPNFFCESLDKCWSKIGDTYFSRLEKLTKRPVFSESPKAYITTVGRSAYHLLEGYFTVSMHRQILQALRTCGHELLHMQVENYFGEEITKKIGALKFDMINESLTVLLNSEFRDLWFMEDKGYSSHIKLRKFISEEWNKEKDFENLIKKCTDYLKN